MGDSFKPKGSRKSSCIYCSYFFLSSSSLSLSLSLFPLAALGTWQLVPLRRSSASILFVLAFDRFADHLEELRRYGPAVTPSLVRAEARREPMPHDGECHVADVFRRDVDPALPVAAGHSPSPRSSIASRRRAASQPHVRYLLTKSGRVLQVRPGSPAPASPHTPTPDRRDEHPAHDFLDRSRMPSRSRIGSSSAWTLEVGVVSAIVSSSS